MIDTIATKAVEQNAEILTDLAKKIWEHPETAFHEVKACEWTAEVLKNAGFGVEIGYVGNLGKRPSQNRISGRI